MPILQPTAIMCLVDGFFVLALKTIEEFLLMLKRNKNKKAKGEVTFTLQRVPKSYEDMTPEEKMDWALEVLGGMRPNASDNS